MKAHHLVNEINQRAECPYCRKSLTGKDWESIFEFWHHYKQTNCDGCGRNISVKVHFTGSGHDCWDPKSKFCKLVGGTGTEIKPLEEKIKEK
jgi:hypothetical protein